MELSEDEIKGILKWITVFNSKNSIARKMVSNEEDRHLIFCFFVELVMGTISGMESLTRNTNTFNVEEVVKVTVNLVMRKLASGCSDQHIHWAPTQSGKSAFKAVVICTYLAMNVPVLVLTKGKKESEELVGKISCYIKGSRFESKILCVYRNKMDHIERTFWNDKEASALFIPDTCHKIELSYEYLTEGMKYSKRRGRRCAGCALILDEVDAIIDRSENQDQRNEKGLNKLLRDLKPSVVKVTATPIPLFSKSLDKNPIITTSNETIQNYVGVKDMLLFQDLDQETLNQGFGKEVKKFIPTYKVTDARKTEKSAMFPEEDRFQLKRKFPNVWNKKNPVIPKINFQVIKLVRKEITKKGANGALILVDTCPWVDSSKNDTLFHQASGIQDYFYHIGKKFIPIVVHAECVYYRLPGHSYSLKCRRPLCELIDKIDSNKEYGLKMPMVVFGYYAMKRSRSFRSSQRVPTSMIMSLGAGQSNENVRQAAGRVTYKGRDVLLRNRNTENVQMLCPDADFQIVQQYDALVKEIFNLYKKNLSWNDIYWKLQRSSKNFFLRDSKRKTGNYIPDEGKNRRQGKRNTVLIRSTDKETTGRRSVESTVASVPTTAVESPATAAPDQVPEDNLNVPSNAAVGSPQGDINIETMSSEPENDQEILREGAFDEDPHKISADENSDRQESPLSDELSNGSSSEELPSTGKSTPNQQVPNVIDQLTPLFGKRKESLGANSRIEDWLKNYKKQRHKDGNGSSSSGDHLLSLEPGENPKKIAKNSEKRQIDDRRSSFEDSLSVPSSEKNPNGLLGKRNEPPEAATKIEDGTQKRQKDDSGSSPNDKVNGLEGVVKTEDYDKRRNSNSTEEFIDLFDGDDEDDAIDLTFDD